MSVNKKSLKNVEGLFDKTPQALFGRLRSDLRAAAIEWEKGIQGRLRGPLPGPGRRSNTLHRRTGALARSMRQNVGGRSLPSLNMRLSSAGVPYARLHELGGVITPKRAKFLTIPMPDNMTPAGVTRKSARAALSEGRTGAGRFGVIFLRTRKGLFIVRTGARRRISSALGQTRVNKHGRTVSKNTTRKDTFEFLFRLVKRVKVDPRLGFFKTWDKQVPKLRRNLADSLGLELRDAKGRA